MNKSLGIIASLALMVTLAGCPSNNPATNPTPSPSASATPSSSTATPTPGPGTSTPTPGPTGPTATPTPLPSSQALPTPPPSINQGFSITGATAVKQPDFSYVFTITGTDLGAVANYSLLEADVSGATVLLVVNGQTRLNGNELREVSVTPTQITFRWLNPLGAPTANDLVKLNYTKTGESAKVSTPVRLSVQ